MAKMVNKIVTLDDVKKHHLVNKFIEIADSHLGVLGYTEHGFRHATLVSNVAKNVLLNLGYSSRLCELGAISGYLHDIGNVINRTDHGRSSALLSLEILDDLNMPAEEIAIVISAIGNHEEEIGEPVSPVCASLILADKTDVNKARVRDYRTIQLDIHDRVNYAVERNFLEVFPEKKVISVKLDIDTKVSQILEYFEIFMSRLVMCRRAANYLNYSFELIINNQKVV